MLVITLMVIIGLKNSANLWLYLALGLSSFGLVLRAAEKQVKQQKVSAETNTAVEDFLKAIQAKLN